MNFGPRRARITVAFSVLVVLAIRAFLSVGTQNPNLTMGNPSKATTDLSNKNNYLMVKPYFALSYNNTRGAPNWVSWRLSASDIGTAPRVSFYPDPDLPAGFKVVTPKDYTGSGFDRGHMCPHGDRTATDEMSRATFVMTNIIPQSPNVNQKAWDQLEMYCRSLAEQGKVLYIVDGPYGVGGTGRNGRSNEIGTENSVTVPSRCWKAVMVLDGGAGSDLAKVTSKTRLIAVIMPNDMSVGEDWARYRVPVRDVERLTGYKFFDKVPAAIIGPLKNKTDKTPIPPPTTPRYGY